MALALHEIDRADIIQMCARDMQAITDARERQVADETLNVVPIELLEEGGAQGISYPPTAIHYTLPSAFRFHELYAHVCAG